MMATYNDIEFLKKVGEVVDTKRAVTNYRNAPANVTKAMQAAAYYAKRDKKDYMIVKTISYGHAIFHIYANDEDFTKSTVMSKNVWGGYVEHDTMDVYEVKLNRVSAH